MKGWGRNPVLAGSHLIKELLLLQLEPSGRFPPVLGCQDQELQGGFIDTESGLAAKSCVCWAFNITSLLLEIIFLKKSLWFWVAISVCKSWCCPCLNFYVLLHVLYFVSIMLFFPISLLLPHSEPGYDWWWGEILVCCCGELCDHRVATYRLICRFTFLVLRCCVANALVWAEHAGVTGPSRLVLSSPLLSARSFQGHSKFQLLRYAGKGRRVGENPPGQASAALSSCWR